jgi:hypothetical protein
VAVSQLRRFLFGGGESKIIPSGRIGVVEEASDKSNNHLEGDVKLMFSATNQQ